MPSSVRRTFVGRESGTDTKNGCKEATLRLCSKKNFREPFGLLTISARVPSPSA